jgi:hypothetical protein
MHKTAKAASPPFLCAVTGRHESDEGFIEIGPLAGVDPQVYLSMGAARDVGRMAGMFDAQERDQLVAELEAAQEQIDALNAQVEEFEEFKRAVDFTFKGIDKLRKPPGPTPAKRGA